MGDWTFTPTGGSPLTLKVLADGVPRKTSPDINLRHIPGGATTYVDIGGANLIEIDLSVLFLTGADALAVEALEGQTGTLVGGATDLGGTGHAPVILNTIQRMSRGVNTAGPVVLSVNFLITGAAS